MIEKKEKIGLDEIPGIGKIPELKKVGEFGKARGLMFRRRKHAKALLFEFPKPVELKIHSLFVKFPFLAIWINNSNKIIMKKIIRPWNVEIGPNKPFKKLIEIPINDFYRREIKKIIGSQKSL